MTEVNTTSQAAAATALNSSSKAPTTAAAASPNGKANTSSKTAGQRQTASVSSSKDSSSHNNNNTRNNNNNGNRSSSSKDTNSDSLGEIWFDTMRRNRGDTSTPSSPTNSSEQDGEGGNSSDCSSNSNHGNNADVIMTENNAVTKDNNNKNKYVDKMQPMSGLSDGGPEDKVQGGDNTNTSNNKDQDQAKASPVCNATDEHAAAALMAEAGNSKQKKRKHNEAAAAGGNHAAANNAAHPNNSGPKKAKVDSSSNKNGATANNTAGSTSKPTAPGANTGTGAGAATTSGYMSDDEGFNDREGADRDENVSNSVSDYNNYKDDSSGSSRNNLAAVVMAANALLEQHKQQDKQDQLDKDNRDQMELDEMEAVNVISATKNDPVTTTAAVQQAAAAKPVTNSSPHNNNSSSNTNTKNKTADTTKRQQGSNAINKKKKVVIDVPQTQTQTQTSQPRGGVKKVGKRVERNAREKERSGKINDQFNELKDLLAQNGIVVPKGTKGSILGITHQYILALQQAQRQKEQDTFSLQQQVEAIAKGSMGSEASRALFHSAQKQGLALDPSMAPPGVFLASSPQQQEQQQQEVPSSPPVYNPLTSVGEADYPSVWHKCPAAMAMATLGGTFVDCNQVFCELLQCSKAELCQLSIFHLLNNNTADSGNNPGSTGCSKADLRFAFDQISQLLEKVNSKSGSGSSSSSGEDDGSGKSSVSSLSSSPSSPVALRGSVQGQEHLGLAISMIKSNAKDSGAKHHHLCVTITRRPLGDSNNSENKIIVPATLENVAGAASGGSMASPSTSSAASASTPGSFKKPHLQGLTATAPQYAIG